MAASVEPYKDLNHALKKMRVQILDSLEYAQTECPQFQTPEQIFNWLKQRTVYKKDPKNRETFQTLETLLDPRYNIHGIAGAGDCDCLTIGLISLLTANGFYNLNDVDSGIVLVSRNRFIPVHIYSYTHYNGNKEYLDLTNQWYNYERDGYNFKQEIPFKLNKLEEKEMILELADGFDQLLGRKSNKQATKQPTQKKVARQEKRQAKRAPQTSALLPPPADDLTPVISPKVTDNYVYLPESSMHVREDYFDDLEPAEFQNTMLEEGVSPHKIFELSAKRAERKATRKATPTKKQAAKQKKVETKQSSKTARTKAKAAGKSGKAEAKANRPARLSPEQKEKIFGAVKDTAGAAIKKYTGTKTETETETDKTDSKAAAKTTNIFGMELTTPQLVGGGIGLLVIGAIAIKKLSKKN